MKIPCLWKRARRALSVLSLADKCLLIFMLILMVQSAHNLFFHELAMQESNSFDVIVRTTAAAIFGYFISSNFQNGGRDTSKQEYTDSSSTTTLASHSDSKVKAKIGFASATDPVELQSGYARINDKNPLAQRNHLQILVVAGIGLLSLSLLLITDNYFATSNMATATISQLRDFVSGSVGFLIGHSTHPTKPS